MSRLPASSSIHEALARAGLIAEEDSSGLRVYTPDGVQVAGPGAPVRVSPGPPHVVEWRGGRLEARDPWAAALAVYAAYTAHSWRAARRHASRAATVLGLVDAGDRCREWAGSLAPWAPRPCTLAVTVAAAWITLESRVPDHLLREAPHAGDAERLRDAVCRLPPACAAAESAARILLEAPDPVHSLAHASLPLTALGAGDASLEAAAAAHAALHDGLDPEPGHPGLEPQAAWAAWAAGAPPPPATGPMEAALAAVAHTPVTAHSTRTPRGRPLTISANAKCRRPCLRLGPTAARAAESARLQGSRATIYTLDGRVLAAAIEAGPGGTVEVARGHALLPVALTLAGD